MHIRPLLLATLPIILHRASATPLEVHPGDAGSVVLTSDDTVNATHNTLRVAAYTGYMQLSIFNNLPSSNVNFYITGLDVQGAVVLLQPNGTWFHPNASSTSLVPVPITADVSIPLGPEGSVTNITLPGYVSSARVWFADGNLTFYTVYGEYGPSLVEPSFVNPNDPSADVNFGFVELSYGEDIIYVNISFVDFVGLPLGISLFGGGGVQTVPGVEADAVENICEALEAQAAADGYPWDDLCMTNSNGTALRVLSPTNYLSIEPDAFEDYWTAYVDEVWTYYSINNLTMVTSGEYGDVNCSVNIGGNLTCVYDNRGYEKPSALDIFGCNQGPFSLVSTDNVVHQRVVPILCAAIQRSTLLLEVNKSSPPFPPSLRSHREKNREILTTMETIRAATSNQA